MATLPPPPLPSPLTQRDGTLTSTWARWLSLLQSIFAGYASPSGDQTPSLLNGWVASGGVYTSPLYWKDAAGRVYLRGTIKNGTMGANAFVLPAGFRPSGILVVPVYSANSGGTQVLASLVVDSTGHVQPHVGDNAEFHLHCSFRAEG